ncbi:hypothetical protein ACFL19_01845 [Pseudomonadota bacterium]
MNVCQTILTNVLSGIITAGAIWLLALLWNRQRNKRLEKIISDGVNSHGIGYNQEDFHIIFENKTPVSIRVRTILLMDSHIGFLELKYRRPVSQASLINAIVYADDQAKIDVQAHFPTNADHEDAKLMPPYTGGVWGVEKSQLFERAWEINKCLVIVEYPTILGGSAFMRIEFNESNTNQIVKMIEDLKQMVPAKAPRPDA